MTENAMRPVSDADRLKAVETLLMILVRTMMERGSLSPDDLLQLGYPMIERWKVLGENRAAATLEAMMAEINNWSPQRPRG